VTYSIERVVACHIHGDLKMLRFEWDVMRKVFDDVMMGESSGQGRMMIELTIFLNLESQSTSCAKTAVHTHGIS